MKSALYLLVNGFSFLQVSYILFSGTPNPSSFCIHTLLYRVIVNSDNSIIFTFETAISEKQEVHKQIKKLKLANKQADIQAFLLPLHSKPPFPKQRFRKITSKRNCKIIEETIVLQRHKIREKLFLKDNIDS